MLDTRTASQPQNGDKGAQPRGGDMRAVLIGGGVLVVLLLLAPLFFYDVFLMKVLCFALFACAFNLLLGYGGLLSFGHAAFFGGASYISANALLHWGFTPELAVLAGGLWGAVAGYVMGAIAIRRKGIYFAMTTLALSQMVYFIALRWRDFTQGEDGVQGVPRGHLFGLIDISDSRSLYYFVAVVFLIGFAILYRVVYSPFGQVLRAIKENEPRAISLGYSVDRYKLTAFVISSTLTGVAGATKAMVVNLASLTDVTWQMSGEVILMTLLGGMGTIFGPAVGAAFVASLESYTPPVAVPILIGSIFVICVLAFRRGIVGEILARNLKAAAALGKVALGVLVAWTGAQLLPPEMLTLGSTGTQNFAVLGLWFLMFGIGFAIGEIVQRVLVAALHKKPHGALTPDPLPVHD